MTTLTRIYATELAARHAVRALRATGVAERDIRLLVGIAPRDIRREPVGGFAGPVAPYAPIGTYGGRVLRRRQGAGSFAGDPDQQRQGSFADTDRVVIVTHDGDAERADHRPPRSPAAPVPGRTRRRGCRPRGGRSAPRARDPPPRAPRDLRKRSGCAARESRPRRLSAFRAPRAAPDRAPAVRRRAAAPTPHEAEQHVVGARVPARAGVRPETNLAAAADPKQQRGRPARRLPRERRHLERGRSFSQGPFVRGIRPPDAGVGTRPPRGAGRRLAPSALPVWSCRN